MDVYGYALNHYWHEFMIRLVIIGIGLLLLLAMAVVITAALRQSFESEVRAVIRDHERGKS